MPSRVSAYVPKPTFFNIVTNKITPGPDYGKQLREPNAWQQKASNIQNRLQNNGGVQQKIAQAQQKKGTVRFFSEGDRRFTVGPKVQAMLEGALGKTGGDITRAGIDAIADYLSHPSFSLARAEESFELASAVHHGDTSNPNLDSATYYHTRMLFETAPVWLTALYATRGTSATVAANRLMMKENAAILSQPLAIFNPLTVNSRGLKGIQLLKEQHLLRTTTRNLIALNLPVNLVATNTLGFTQILPFYTPPTKNDSQSAVADVKASATNNE